MTNKQEAIQQVAIEHYCKVSRDLVTRCQKLSDENKKKALNEAFEGLAPKDHKGQPNFSLLMWRIAYLLKNLETSQVAEKEKDEKRKLLGVLALYLYNEKNINPAQCVYFGKTAADLLVKAYGTNNNRNSLYPYLAPSQLLPAPSLGSKLSWLSPISKEDKGVIRKLIGVILPVVTIGIIAGLSAGILGAFGLGAASIVAGVGISAALGAAYLRGGYLENKEDEYNTKVRPVVQDVWRNFKKYDYIVGNCEITPEQRKALRKTPSIQPDSLGKKTDPHLTNNISSVTEVDMVREYQSNKDNTKEFETSNSNWKNYATSLKVGLQSNFWQNSKTKSEENYSFKTAYEEYKSTFSK